MLKGCLITHRKHQVPCNAISATGRAPRASSVEEKQKISLMQVQPLASAALDSLRSNVTVITGILFTFLVYSCCLRLATAMNFFLASASSAARRALSFASWSGLHSSSTLVSLGGTCDHTNVNIITIGDQIYGSCKIWRSLRSQSNAKSHSLLQIVCKTAASVLSTNCRRHSVLTYHTRSY